MCGLQAVVSIEANLVRNERCIHSLRLVVILVSDQTPLSSTNSILAVDVPLQLVAHTHPSFAQYFVLLLLQLLETF